MRTIWETAWHRFTIVSGVVSDATSRVVSVLFYFTILVPFGVGYTLFADPMHTKNNQPRWFDRAPIPTDIESAKEQG